MIYVRLCIITVLVIISYCISLNISNVKHWWIDLKPTLVKKLMIWACHSYKVTLKLENIGERASNHFTDMRIWCIDSVQFCTCTPTLVHVLVLQAGYCYSGFYQINLLNFNLNQMDSKISWNINELKLNWSNSPMFPLPTFCSRWYVHTVPSCCQMMGAIWYHLFCA